MNGYILTSRSLTGSPIWNKPPLYIKVWMYLLLNANYSDSGGLKRGQIRTSIPEIQEACSYHVGYRKVTPTYKEVRDVIDFLRRPYEVSHEGDAKGSMIVTTKVTHGFIATICNYSVYQDPNNYEGQREGNTKETRRARQGHNKKNTYKERNNNNTTTVNSSSEYKRPTLEEVRAYVSEKCLVIDPEYFYEYYVGTGWKDTRGNDVRNWKLKALSWNRRDVDGDDNRAGYVERAGIRERSGTVSAAAAGSGETVWPRFKTMEDVLRESKRGEDDARVVSGQ